MKEDPESRMVMFGAAVALVLALACTGLVAWCGEPAFAEERPVELDSGAAAPYAGLLVPRDQALRAIRCQRLLLPQCLLDAGAEQARLTLRLQLCEQLKLVERRRADALASQLEETATLEPPQRSWWEHPGLWAAVGVAAGVGLTVLVTELVKEKP